jgi:hypothetical protein
MNARILDLYTDYLICSFGATTATGLSALTDGAVSHDKVTRFLSDELFTSADLWKIVKPTVRKVQSEDAVLIIDDSVEEKPYTDENELICWHFDHMQNKSVKGINLVSTLYQSNGMSLPVAFELIKKTESYIDPKTGKQKRKCPKTKNEYYRQMVQTCVDNEIPFRYVLNDVWFSSAENMRFVKETIKRDFVMPLKGNRNVATSRENKNTGKFVSVSSLSLEENTTVPIWLEGIPFEMLLLKQVFTNADGSIGVLYLVTSDTSLSAQGIKDIYHKRWKVEEYHKSIKSNASFAKSPTKRVMTQSNHFFASICAYVKLAILSSTHKMNHFAVKAKLYQSALASAYQQLQELTAALAARPALCVT